MRLFDIPIDIPEYVPPTAWLRHGPFAMWLVRAMRPRRIVELGSHHGYSYFCFCQAVAAAGLQTQCFAVDTWAGDEHAGYYGDTVYKAVKEQNENYKTFGTLLKKTFADALSDIEDGSIDLLHIDGRHYYNDVKEDFETWIPKLSDRAVVLFHDTEVRENNFGVWRYWSEISLQHPSLNFSYQHGLGVLFWGRNVAEGLAPFVSLLGRDEINSLIIPYFHLLGDSFARNLEIESEARRTETELRYSLREARRYPLMQLKKKFEFYLLYGLVKAEAYLPPRFAEKLRCSMAKRDPDREEPQNGARNKSMQR